MQQLIDSKDNGLINIVTGLSTNMRYDDWLGTNVVRQW